MAMRSASPPTILNASLSVWLSTDVVLSGVICLLQDIRAFKMIAGLSKDKVLPLIGRLVRTKTARPEDTSCDGTNASTDASAGHLKVSQQLLSKYP